MEKRLDCKDVGLDCDYMVCTLSGEEVIRTMGGHMQVFHGMKQFSKGFYKKAGAAIREGICGLPKDRPGACASFKQNSRREAAMTLDYRERCLRRNGSDFCQDLMIIGDQILENWRRKKGHSVDGEDVTDILAASPEVFVVGMGYAGFMEVSDSLLVTLKNHNIQLIAGKTPEAVKAFNQVHSKGKRVAGAFHLTC